MTTKKTPPTLDIDRTRERLVSLGLAFAAEHLDSLLSAAVKDTVPHLVGRAKKRGPNAKIGLYVSVKADSGLWS